MTTVLGRELPLVTDERLIEMRAVPPVLPDRRNTWPDHNRV